ncbi:MAG: NAD(P)/FAD-dependent oxidoreductase [Chloroflexota bacterium]
MTQNPKVIIIGAGFGGLFAARELANQSVDVLLVDRNNYHTFTPLLYQVATAALDPSQIAYPVRSIFRSIPNIHFLLGIVTKIDAELQQVTIMCGEQPRTEVYDYLIVAAGSVPTYFGSDDFRQYAFELRTLHDSIRLRNHVLNLFEEAVWTEDDAHRNALLTVVVVGGGPTGLETAGAVFELYNHVLNQDYPQADLKAKVILVEMQNHLLGPYPSRLRQAAQDQLESLGVEVQLGHRVTEVYADRVVLDDGSLIPSHTLVWSAGVKAAPVAELLATELRSNGTIPIDSTTRVQGMKRVFAIGDNAYLPQHENVGYPMLIPVAQQQGQVAARNVLADLNGTSPKTFRYVDKGIMATIGRSRAVAWIFNRFALTGRLAWLAWLGLHLVMLLGFRNRLSVFINWIWNYITYDRSVRIIWRQSAQKSSLSDSTLDEQHPVLLEK